MRLASRPVSGISALGLAFTLFTALPAIAQEYTIGPEDVLQIAVWLRPELDKTVTVGPDGNITFAPAGEIKASGLTPKQLGDRLAERLSTYLRQTTTVTVTVSQYLSRSVFVVGAVGRPGRYGFQALPSLVDVISQAGGANPGADLSHVQIIRREGEVRRVLNADVSSALRGGVGSDLPALRPGDTVVINSTSGGAYTGASGDAIAVVGEVQKPGLYPSGSGVDLWVVLAQAGGFTPRANLGKVRVVSQAANGSRVRSIDLKAASSNNGVKPVLVQPGDVVFVTPTGTNVAWNLFLQTMAISRDVLNIVIAIDLLQDNDR